MILWLGFINNCPSGLYVKKFKKCTVWWATTPRWHIFFNNNFNFFNKSMIARFLKWIVDCFNEKKIKNSKRVNFGFGSFINDCPSGLYLESQEMHSRMSWNSMLSHHFFFSLKSNTRLKNKAVLPFLSCEFNTILWLSCINDCPSRLDVEIVIDKWTISLLNLWCQDFSNRL